MAQQVIALIKMCVYRICEIMNRFTLIELLVVIAIIGILTSIMLPSLSKAREKGIASVCLSNLKQSQLQTVFYTSNYDDIMHMYDSTDPWGGWATKLENTYLSAGERSTFCPKATPNINSVLLLKQKTYGGNYQALYKQTAWANRSWMIFNGSNYFKRIIILPKPSDYIFLGDTISKGIWQNR